jgi:hypothetical protein
VVVAHDVALQFARPGPGATRKSFDTGKTKSPDEMPGFEETDSDFVLVHD